MPSKIIRLTVNNMLRIEAAEVTPDGALVIVAGQNDQGKTSLLNCIGIALGGKGKIQQPIRQGATSGEIVLETESLIVTRKFRSAGNPTLEVRDKEKGVITSPQTKLDTLYRLTTFDPLTFTREEPKKKAVILRDLAGLDTSDLDAEHGKLFADRTEVGRKRDDQKGRVGGITRDISAPKELVSVADLTQELQAANEKNEANARARESVTDCLDNLNEAEMQANDAENAIAELKEKLATAEKALDQKRQAIEVAKSALSKMRESANALVDVPTAPILEKMTNAETINAKVRANTLWEEEQRKLVKLEGDYQKLTVSIDKIRADREKRIASAKYPVEGLGFTEDGVTFDGVPFEQCSSSKQIRVSLAIACALNPELRVMLIRDGSLLDAKSLELVREFAEAHDAQVFLEAVGNRDDATVIIEAGSVVATPASDAKAAKERK